MIYTVTLNPAVDLLLYIKDLDPGKTHRAHKEYIFPGGKGINVSRILNRFHIPSTALGFAGGFTGDHLADRLNREGIQTRFIKTAENTRINIKIKNEAETQINGPGPNLSEKQILDFLAAFDNIDDNDWVVLSGSKPASLPEDFYQTLVEKLHRKQTPFILDTSGEELRNGILKKPFLIKPNQEELEELFGKKHNTMEDYLHSGRKLLEMGAQNALISLGQEGSLFFADDNIYKARVPKGKAVNSVGSGDSMIGGFLAKYLEKKDLLESFRYGNMAGAATAFTEDLASCEEILSFKKDITIEKIK